MTASQFSENIFLNRLTEIIHAKLKNEQFGVSGLVREMRMNLLFNQYHFMAFANQKLIFSLSN